MGEYQATITSATLFIILLLSASILIIPRKYLLLPFAVAACWAPADQHLLLFQTFHFRALHILILVAAARLWLYGEIVPIRWNRFDALVLAWVVVGTIIFFLQWLNLASLIFKSGRLLEWLGLYWIFRQTVRSWADLRFAYVVLAVCALAMLPFVALERATGENPFVVLGRVRTSLRDGNIRCAATFPHSIIMGLFWATLVPLFVGFARQQPKHRVLLWLAVAASAFMVVATSSSTPVLTLLAVAILLLLYPLRHYSGTAAWATVALLACLHVVMRAPVWHLLARVGIISGSTGWHRYYLVNQAIAYFREWMLLGTRSTAHWGWGLSDVTNQFVLEAANGGLITLVLFCIMLIALGRAYVRLSLHPTEKGESYLAWGILVTLLAHVISFFGVSYFGQITMPWYLLLASGACFYERAYAPPVPVASRQLAAAGLQQAYR